MHPAPINLILDLVTAQLKSMAPEQCAQSFADVVSALLESLPEDARRLTTERLLAALAAPPPSV